MASNPNRSRDLMEIPMKILTRQQSDFATFAQPIDDQARLWMGEQFPADRNQYYGHALVVPRTDVENFENKFIDAGGQLL